MGYYNILKYFIRRLFSFLRSITGKLFLIFVLLFGVLILYMSIDKGVFAESVFSLNDSIYSSSNLSSAQSLAGSAWNDEDYDIFIMNDCQWGNSVDYLTWQKGVFYWKVDTSLPNCRYYFQTDTISYPPNDINNGTTKSPYYQLCLANLDNSDVSVSGYYRKSFERYQNVVEGGGLTYSNISNVGWFSNYSVDLSFSGISTINRSNHNQIYCKVIRSHYDLCDSQGNVIVPATHPLTRDPYIVNQSSSIENWSFDYLNINSGSVGYVYYDDLLDTTSYADLNLKYIYDGITYTQSIPSGFLVDWSDENFTLEIPRTWLLSNVNIQNGKSVDFYLEVKKQNVSDNIYFLGIYTLSLTSAEQEQIQQDNDKALQGQILESQQQTNNKLDNLDNTINDSNIDNITSDTLPSDSTTDITANGVNGIFTSIYNAFCVGNAQDIVFPIPFTDKSITLSPNYLSNALSSSGATFIITIIQAFWWYIISRFIIKDVMNKINKIKSGNIEDIETTNIRGDML